MNLHARVDAYLQLRRSLGFKARAEEAALRSFVRFLESRNCTDTIPAQMALDWACPPSSSAARSIQVRRFTCARHFLGYLKAFLPGIEVPAQVLREPRRTRPYVYSEEEIVRMQEVTRDIWAVGSLQQITLETIIGLLASGGLRIGEALRLTMRDVQINLDPPRLEIRNTKFNKSRFVPVQVTTAEQLRRYREQRGQPRNGDPTEPFFVFTPGEALHHAQVDYCIRKIVRRAGIQ